MKNINLTDGVDLHIIDAPKFKTNLISVYLNIPFKRDMVTKTTLLPAVLKRGCESYPTLKDMSRRLEELYGATFSAGVRPKGDGEALYFSASYIAERFIGEELTGGVAEFIRDFMLSPLTEEGGFLKKFVDSEKENLRNVIKGVINDKKEYAEARCREEMFGKEGYGLSDVGYEEDLCGITPQNLYSYYLSLLNTAKVDIFISGNVSASAEEIVKSVLGSRFSGRSAGYISPRAEAPSGGGIKEVTEDADVVQSKLCIGLRCGIDAASEDYYALALATCIFGGSPFSKLFNNVREKLSLAYYALAKTSMFKSVMLISSGIQTENYQKAYDEITVQFENMQNGAISDEEISAAKKFLNNAYFSINDSLRHLEDYYLSRAILGSDMGIEEFIGQINKVDKRRICKVMQGLRFDTVFFLKGKTAEEAEI